MQVDHRPLWLLACGFGAVVLVLLVSGLLLLNAIDLEGAVAGQFSAHQLSQMELIDKLQLDQTAVGELLYAMSADQAHKQSPNHRQESQRLRHEILALASEANRQKLTEPERAAWAEMAESATKLFDSVEGSIGNRGAASLTVVNAHRRFIAAVARLLDTSYQDARERRAEVMRSFANYFSWSATLLGGAVVLAIAGTIGSILFTFRLFGNLERQAGTLRELALHILDEQERSAKRFSQELHDEFGQTLNAIEATLSLIRADNPEGSARLEDAKAMVRDSIANARDMARLLRPSILDDFGLDASLRELAQGFSQRTGIVVDYSSTLRDRLAPDTETHLYRIAQEALTNVSRHSAARHVAISLSAERQTLRFRITDDGGGMANPSPGRPGLGLIGMAERANAAGGRIDIRNNRGRGVDILVEAPLEKKTHE